MEHMSASAKLEARQLLEDARREGRPQAKGTRAFEDVLEGLSVPFLAHMKEHKILYRSH